MGCESEDTAEFGNSDQKECCGCVLSHLLRWLGRPRKAHNILISASFPGALTKYPDLHFMEGFMLALRLRSIVARKAWCQELEEAGQSHCTVR